MGRDIVGFSVPFSIGIIIGVILPISLNLVFIVASILLVFIVVFLWLYIRYDYIQLILILAFFLGSLCGVCSHLGVRLEFFESEAAFNFVLDTINNIGFADSDISSLSAALLTGYRDGLSPEVVDNFRAAGASHILALSGFHFGIIYAILNRLLLWMRCNRVLFNIKSLIIIAFSIYYTSLTGASPSLVRALLFVCLNEILLHSRGRKKRKCSIFCTALLIQLLMNPQVVLSLGFQLSYLAMLGITLIFPYLSSWFNEEKRVLRRVWDMVSLSISCQLTTAPLVWLRFRSFPIYFLITNLFALPLVSVFISSLLFCLFLEFLGLDFAFAKIITESLGQCLLRLLELISGL